MLTAVPEEDTVDSALAKETSRDLSLRTVAASIASTAMASLHSRIKDHQSCFTNEGGGDHLGQHSHVIHAQHSTAPSHKVWQADKDCSQIVLKGQPRLDWRSCSRARPVSHARKQALSSVPPRWLAHASLQTGAGHPCLLIEDCSLLCCRHSCPIATKQPYNFALTHRLQDCDGVQHVPQLDFSEETLS